MVKLARKFLLPGGVMVARCALDAEIGVRIPAGQPIGAPL